MLLFHLLAVSLPTNPFKPSLGQRVSEAAKVGTERAITYGLAAMGITLGVAGVSAVLPKQKRYK